MEEVFTPLQLELIDAIYDSLQNHIYSNAVFLAERLLAENDCEESRALLAECYLSEMKAYKAYYILKDCKSEHNRYKFAIICLKLNKFKEAEKSLLSSSSDPNTKFLMNPNFKFENVPNGAYGLHLLGIISEKLQKVLDAKEYYKKALELNPTLWAAYEKLLKLGELIEPSDVFQDSRFKVYESTRKRNISSYLPLLRPQSGSSMTKIFKATESGFEERPGTSERSTGFPLETDPFSQFGQSGGAKPRAAPPKTYNFSTNSNSLVNNFNISLEDSNPVGSIGMRQVQGTFPGVPTQQSQPGKFSFNQFMGGRSTGRPGTEPMEFLTPGGGNRAQGQSQSSLQNQSSNQKNTPQRQINDLMTLLTCLSEPYLNLLSYNCQASIDAFQKLPPSHFNTGWVLSNIGRAYWECVKYSEAEKYFEEAYRIEPYRLEGLEYYSTCLWHMKKQVELCNLAYSALEKSMFAPEPWIVLGNCFSLQKEHENALKFFNRAIQLNSSFAYAHTLSGHEYVYNEDFHKARKCFENALSIDIRHYNAWWGLGYIYYKQEKYERAIDNFQKAIAINSKNPVLYSYLGMTYAAQDDLIEALRCFQHSEAFDDKNVMNRFQKANVLCKLGRFDQALTELEALRVLMPREAPIPQLIGKIYKQLGVIDKAHHFFTLALDLENKDSQKIKAMIDSLHNTNEFNDDADL